MPTARTMIGQCQDENVANRPLAQFPTDIWVTNSSAFPTKTMW